MLTLIPLLNPRPRGWGAAKKRSKRRKPIRETSVRKTKRKKRSSTEAVMAKRRKRTASGRFVSKKRSSGKRRRRSARRRSSGTTRVRRRKRRGLRRARNPRGAGPRGSGGRFIKQIKDAISGGTKRRKRRKSSGRRRSKRRVRAVYVRRKRGRLKGKLRNLRRRIYTRSRKGKYRRANPGRSGGSIYSRAFSLDTVIQVGQIGLGVLINQAAPIYIAKWTGRSDLNRGLMGGVAAIGGNVAVAALLSLLGQKQLAYKTLVGGVLSSVGRVAQIGLGAINRRSMPAALPGPGAPVSGMGSMGSIVSPESMVEAQALLGDFVQLSGGIPRRDFRGMGDYIEFKSQAAGANAMAAQLATSEVFSPGADEKF